MGTNPQKRKRPQNDPLDRDERAARRAARNQEPGEMGFRVTSLETLLAGANQRDQATGDSSNIRVSASALLEERTAQIANLRQAHENVITNLRRHHEDAIADRELEHQDALRDLRNKTSEEVARLQNELAAARRNHTELGPETSASGDARQPGSSNTARTTPQQLIIDGIHQVMARLDAIEEQSKNPRQQAPRKYPVSDSNQYNLYRTSGGRKMFSTDIIDLGNNRTNPQSLPIGNTHLMKDLYRKGVAWSGKDGRKGWYVTPGPPLIPLQEYLPQGTPISRPGMPDGQRQSSFLGPLEDPIYYVVAPTAREYAVSHGGVEELRQGSSWEKHPMLSTYPGFIRVDSGARVDDQQGDLRHYKMLLQVDVATGLQYSPSLGRSHTVSEKATRQPSHGR